MMMTEAASKKSHYEGHLELSLRLVILKVRHFDIQTKPWRRIVAIFFLSNTLIFNMTTILLIALPPHTYKIILPPRRASARPASKHGQRNVTVAPSRLATPSTVPNTPGPRTPAHAIRPTRDPRANNTPRHPAVPAHGMEGGRGA